KGGGIAAGIAQALDLNTYNFIFLLAGLLLHWRPRRFLEAVTRSVPATAGVLIQFPFYAGIFGMITGTASDPSPISQWLAGLFPLLGLLGVRARDLVGYAAVQLLVHLPVVLFLMWLFARTLAYVAPVVPP